MTIGETLVKNEVFKEPEIKNFNLIFHRDAYILAQRNIYNSMMEFTKSSLDLLYEEIKHGDEEHVKWLKDKIEEFKVRLE